MKEDSIRLQIADLVKRTGNTANSFARTAGLDPSNFKKMLNGDATITVKTLSKIRNAFGVDFGLQSESEAAVSHDGKGGKSDWKKYISNEMIKEGDYSGTLVYDIDATCGMENREIDFANEDVIGSINLPYISKKSVIIRANGDSMQPKICDGDLVAIREIFSWDDVYYGQIYMILLDEYRMIKYIRRCAEDEEHYIILRSENDNYDDIKLHKSKIRKLFLVENILLIKNQL